MSELRTEFTAPSLDEAKTGAIHKLPRGHELIAMTVVTNGKPATVSAEAETREAAHEKAMAALPTKGPKANVNKVTVDYTKRDTQTFKTFRSDFQKTAEQLHAKGKFGELRVLKVSSGRKWSFLGLKRYEHTVDLAGDLRAEVHYHQEAMVIATSKPFMVPAGLSIFLRNPLGTLGLLPHDAAPRRVTERAEELRSLIEVGMDPAIHLDDFVKYSFLTNDTELSVSDVDAAKARLISDRDRLRSELFWFTAINPDTTDVLLAAADYEEALSHMEHRAAKGAAEPKYAAALLRWYRNNSHELTSDISRADGLIGNWLDSLSEWRQLHADGSLLECIRQRAEKLTDPRIDDSYLEGQAQQMLIELCEPVVMLAKAAHAQELTLLAKTYLGAIRDADLPSAVSDHVLEQFFIGWIQTLRAAIESLAAGDSVSKASNKQIEEASKYIARYQGADICSDKLKNQIDELALVLTSRAKKAHSIFEGADSQFFAQSSHLVDVWNQNSEMAVFLAVVDHFETHKKGLGKLQGARDRCIKELKGTRSVAEDAQTAMKAFPAAEKDIKKLLDHIDECQEKTKREFNVTKEHLERNCSSMRQQLS